MYRYVKELEEYVCYIFYNGGWLVIYCYENYFMGNG